MSATQEAVDDLDDATLELVVALQLEDLESIKQQSDNDDPESPEIAAVGQVFADELIQYRAHRQYQDEDTDGIDDCATVEPVKLACVSCEDECLPGEEWQAPCSHNYCIACLETLHRACMTDQTLYPPKCCHQEMPWDAVKCRLGNDLATAFEGKREELDMDVGRRTYCSDAACAKFIGAGSIVDNVATCPGCSRATCTMCKAARHDGDCPADEALQQTLRLAGERGWR
jgi:hypothetical protein